MLKIGQMVASQGVWQGQRIVSKQWIAASTTAAMAIPEFSFVGSARTKAAKPQPTHYGYYWYRERLVGDSFRLRCSVCFRQRWTIHYAHGGFELGGCFHRGQLFFLEIQIAV